MSLITYPVATEPRAFLPRSVSLVQDVNARAFASPFGGSEQAVDLLNDRWRLSMELPPCTPDHAAQREAFISSLRGQVNHTELYHFGRPQPRGTLASCQGLLYDAPQGADSITIATTAGATLLAGDMLGVDGLLLQCRADCTANANGLLVVPLSNRLRRAVPGLRRASTATYVDGAGVLQTAAANVPRFQGGALLAEAAGTNMATRSSVPLGNWALSGVTQGAAVTAPDGTASAVPFLETTVGGVHQTTFSSLNFEAGKRYVFSAFAAEVSGGAKRFACLLFQAGVFGSVNKGVAFDVATGQAGAALNGLSDFGSIAVAGGVRIWAALVAESSGAHIAQMRIVNSINSANATYPGDTASGMVWWGRQVEQKGTGGPSSYVPTTTAAATRAADVLAPVVWQKPTAPFRLVGRPALRYVPGYSESLALDFVEKVD